ncbi:MAG TPA: DEAD/DEAH box helicase, partial [Polyangiaceae bacterium LLY-WYZ-15_(1-7)]|nr:DEAD/DEAH box helicase [Polyangiaceae bacterium LLY-WYZ-15_(1-7)]
MLDFAHPCTRRWFTSSFEDATSAQKKGWPPIVAGDSTLLLAPTGSGKTLAAFLVAIDRLAFGPAPPKPGVRVLYVTPLKALGVDVERNLRAPLAGVAAIAEREGVTCRPVSVGIRSGDTPNRERQRMLREPPEILITTPESLYLMLTSRAASILGGVETLIVDEIHSLVPTKRGAHLALSLERLEGLRDDTAPPIQRIGLSATQRPLDEVARFLGGGELAKNDRVRPRPVTIVDAGAKKDFDIRIEVPVEDMTKLGDPTPLELELGGAPSEADAARDPFEEELFLDEEIPSGNAAGGPARSTSIWPAIHPRLVRLIRDHTSTMIFVNSRRLAERLADAINELAGEELALAHHGSLAKEIRATIEDRLKRGELPAMVATSSLELGIDIGAVDLVVQIEAPPSVASGIQRIGRAGHQVGAVSRGRIFPKYRHDLLACAAVVQHVREGRVEATYFPRNPLDVLAQHLVAATVVQPGVSVDALYALARRAAPFAELPRRSFEGVLDMLSGRYPSERFGELRARLTWDRIEGTLRPRKGARMLAVANAGTIPDRGLYGVFLASSDKPVRVGELDEEMVFESREGDVFLLGASSWRIEEITHDRVLVSPAPGQPGKMPFWHGDRPGRPVEFGMAIGALTRELLGAKAEVAEARLVEHHGLDERAASNLVAYLRDQKEATNAIPTDRKIVIERFVDEIGDWCVTVLSPFGARVHAPWVTAVSAQLLRERGLDADAIWSDDGMVFRFPEADEPPEDALLIPDPEELEGLVTGRLGETA